MTSLMGTPEIQGETVSGKRVKILLVDDTPENLISLEAALESLGEELILARSGREALRFLLEHDFAAILLDVKMPEMDGFETAELIRSRPRSRHTPILFLTGYKNDEHLFRGYNLGAVDFLFKPIIPEVLRSKVAVFVELSRRAELLQRQATALEQQAAALQRTEQRFRSLLEAAPDAMVICRDNREIILVNSRTEDVFCYRREELLGQDIRILVPQWSTALVTAEDEDTEDPEGRPSGISREMEGVRQDGSVFPVEISASPLAVDDALLITSAIRDISERKRIERDRAAAEEQVRELNAHLEERVVERTEQLLRSNEELAQFAYIASHDLQEPLRTVSLYTQLLERRYGQLLEADAREFVGQIVTNAARMELLVRDLLDFSRIDGRDTNYFVVMPADRPLDEALESLAAGIEQTQAVITREPLPKVKADPMQLTRVFQNLIGNAIKYSRVEETPRVHISARLVDDDWEFSVQDNGIGIEPRYAEQVFGIFRRLHGRESPGTGMGLAICKKIVTRHGGRIWVETAQQETGATVRFTLPAVVG